MFNQRDVFAKAIATVAMCLFVSSIKADTVLVSAFDAGFVTMAGGSSKGDGTIVPVATFNYSVGRELHYSGGFLFSPLVPMDRKNYFVFDLSGITKPIVSAEFWAFAGPDSAPPFPGGTHGYESLDPMETFVIAGTTDSIGAMTEAMALYLGNLGGPSGFDDSGDPLIAMAASMYMKLADGPLMGSKDFSPADDGTLAKIPLTAFGVAYLNFYAGGPVILGGKLPTAIPPATPQSIFGFTGPDISGGGGGIPFLVITTVPEPNTFLAVGVGLCALGLRKRRRRTVA